MEYKFWRELFSGNNSIVSTMAFLAILLAAPVVFLSSIFLCFDVLWLGRGLGSHSVKLLIALLTAATGGLGVSMYAKTCISKTVETVVDDIKADDPDAGKESS
jgi:hypothetical protein